MNITPTLLEKYERLVSKARSNGSEYAKLLTTDLAISFTGNVGSLAKKIKKGV